MNYRFVKVKKNINVFYKDDKNNFIRVNKFVADAHGKSKNELEGKNGSELYPAKVAENYFNDDLNVIQSGVAKLNIVEKLETVSGPRWLNTNKIPFVNEQGEIIGIIGISFDITELRETENLKQKNKEMEILNKHFMQVREDERARISREIHDEFGQSMTILKLDLNWMRENLENKIQSIEKINKLIEISNDLIKNIQRISSELRPRMLDDLGLVSSIEWYCGEFEERTGINCKLSLDDIIISNSEKKLAYFRILQEALTNVARHAKAKNIIIKLKKLKKSIKLIIIDDGTGMEIEKLSSINSTGIMGMKERVRLCNGNLKITSKIGVGTKLTTIIPE